MLQKSSELKLLPWIIQALFVDLRILSVSKHFRISDPMFLDVIFFIPTLFTYLLIGLLIVILCFVVIYISHKIYVSVYDNLPLAALPGNSQHLGLRHSNHAMTMREYLDSSLRNPRSNQPSLRSIWIQNRSQVLDSSVLRIVLSLEPCYLVSVEFDINSSWKAVSFMCNCREEPVCAAAEPRPSGSIHIVRFYEHLTKIPRLKVMLKCNQRRPEPRPDSRILLTLDDVIQEARDNQDAQCTDNSAACRPITTRRNSRAAE
ncbi:uncharacterized protein LOC108114290 [Drosophila eugracilis]|uniref:uncharacterized protein LOC108114290 n=1 Tax=Drosophila eugracilis TaxID=29029 RepID=UPI0007E6F078|nr:uncharacterized protein LOC108114290 [Drosophila eugracilis]